MRERPILFNGAMVRAILAGQKTQTRRAVAGVRGDNCLSLRKPTKTRSGIVTHVLDAPGRGLCPFGQPGDRLWVRETTEVDTDTRDSVELARYSVDRRPVCYPPGTGNGYDGAVQHWWYSRDTCPNIHMPRKACRLVLEITAVRVERLQAISAQDCVAEGITTRFTMDGGNDDLRIQFRDLWTSTGGDWDSNPWVWVIEFTRVTA